MWCGGAPTPIVGAKLSVNESSQKRSMRDVLPTVELPSSSSFSSFVLSSSPRAEVILTQPLATRPRPSEGGGGLAAARRAAEGDSEPYVKSVRPAARGPRRSARRRHSERTSSRRRVLV